MFKIQTPRFIKAITNVISNYDLTRRLDKLDGYMKYRIDTELENGYNKYKVTYYIKAKTYSVQGSDIAFIEQTIINDLKVHYGI